VERNRLWILFKNFPFREILLSPAYTAYRYAMHWRGFVSGKGAAGRLAQDTPAWKMLGVVLKAEAAAIAGLPRVLRQRRENRRVRRISTAQFRSLLRQYSMTAEEVALKD